ncbi:gamma carbonic anhydrase family protein [Candidatus Omnitrophota bacterium]
MIDDSVFIAKGVVISGDVGIGKDSSVWYNTVIRGDMGPIRIGDSTNIQDLTMVHVDEGKPCTIGSRVSIGHRAILHGCVVEDDCLIGMGAILLNGVHVGAGSVVGAGAVVTEGTSIPPGSLALGIPAQVVRSVDDVLKQNIESTWRHYLKEADNYRNGKVTVRKSEKDDGA